MLPRPTISTDPPCPILTPRRPLLPPVVLLPPLLVLPRLLLLLSSPVPPTRTRLLSPRLRLPTKLPLKLRRLLSMHPSRLMTLRLRPTSSPPERVEISPPPPPLRQDPMPTGRPTRRDSLSRRISSREVRTRTDS